MYKTNAKIDLKKLKKLNIMFDEIKQTIINMYLSTTILSIVSNTKIQKKYSHTKFKIIPKSEKIIFYLTTIKSAKKSRKNAVL